MGVGVMGVVALVVVAWVAPGTGTTTTTTSSPEVQTEAPPPRPEAFMQPRDCPLYVHGELQGIKKHGETWRNDESACEICECRDGLERCYYHYCNAGLKEGFMTPPSGRPPLDDEDAEDTDIEDNETTEGSGWPPPPLDDYKSYHQGPTGVERTQQPRENDTRPPGFCLPPCKRSCPQGYKVDELKQCLKCSCRKKCPSLRSCRLRCLGGLATDRQGCRMCQCRVLDMAGGGGRHPHPLHHPHPHHHSEANNHTSVSGCMDGSRVHRVGDRWVRGPCVACGCVAPGYTECNITRCPTPAAPCPQTHLQSPPPGAHQACCPSCTDAEVVGEAEAEVDVVQGSSWWEQVDAMPRPNTPPSSTQAGDGTVRSAVQATSVEWWQVWLVTVPLALVFLLVAALALRYWRRYHRDKYDINAYRPTETEKLRPVTTADDHLRGRHI